VIEIGAAAICHSDIRVYLGQKHAAPGVVPGHEIAGTVVESRSDALRVGDRVVVCPIVACGRCDFCLSGRRHRCAQRRTLGYDDHGGLAERLLVPAAILSLGHVLPVPDGLSLQRACLTEPIACVLNSLDVCGVGLGGSLVVVGAGPMGLLHVLLARRLGIDPVIVSEPDEERAATARRLGASEVIDPRRQELAPFVLERTAGAGADAVVVTAGLPGVIDASIAAARRQGVVSLFAGFPPDTTVPFDPNAVHYTELRLTGSQNASIEQYRRILALLPTMPEVDAVTTHRVPLADATQAYEARLRNEGLKSMVLVSEA
jgi:L-iditol 2-dehydrogenase